MSNIIDLQEPFMLGLACAAITPELRSMLIFDASLERLQFASAIFGKLVAAATGKEIKIMQLGTSETDDDLWGHLILDQSGVDGSIKEEASKIQVVSQPGLMMPEYHESKLLLVLIPDLTRLSLAAMRACVTLMGASVAHLERRGRQAQWYPQISWLAACDQSVIGKVSPHLLDRFALRFPKTLPSELDRSQHILDWLKNPYKESDWQPELSESNVTRLKKATNQWADPSDIIQQVFNYDLGPIDNIRRQIALVRLAQALARLDEGASVENSYLEKAAKIIGLGKPYITDSVEPSDSEDESEPKIANDESLESVYEQNITDKVSFEETNISIQVETPVYSPEIEPEIFESTTFPIPYPEDTASIQRESASLKLPMPHIGLASKARGYVIGVEPTSNLQDLSMIGTLFAAAPYQRIRRKNKGESNKKFLLSTSDLRRYRRLPVPEQMLVLVLDYTCLKGIDWQSSLLPYLQWAYVERASITFIQVGALSTTGDDPGKIYPTELHAQKIKAPNLLSPRIESALSDEGGRATPLAHGLDLAYQTLRHALQHGRQTIQQAILVVLTDGRGNIPLSASQKRQIILPVGTKGIEDALSVAHRIRELDSVDVHLLNPQPSLYPRLPFELAIALGAAIDPINRMVEIRGEDEP